MQPAGDLLTNSLKIFPIQFFAMYYTINVFTSCKIILYQIVWKSFVIWICFLLHSKLQRR